jgi:hypothetical protein
MIIFGWGKNARKEYGVVGKMRCFRCEKESPANIPVYMDSEFEGIRTEVRQYSGSSSVLFDRRQKNNIFDYYFRF